MSGIRAKNTRPELSIRKALHRRGFRYRLHSPSVPGKPDIVFPAYKAAVFVHGCFWHGHDCRFFRLPGTRREFWSAKIERNRSRDAEVAAALKKAGWRRLVVWECTLRGQPREAVCAIADQIADWLISTNTDEQIRGA
ncbi:very short patch repair endonuclease [Pseudorhodoplanes sp.]|uniref:very short patch repair endonuclease n=1 Tax=Pseudorhodoplanes sp. TaxID=1934341 RepID=UPI00391B6BA8